MKRSRVARGSCASSRTRPAASVWCAHSALRSTRGGSPSRINEEITRRTRVVRIFPNPPSCLGLVRALCAEVHEGWLEDHRYLNMEFLKEQKKELRTAA